MASSASVSATTASSSRRPPTPSPFTVSPTAARLIADARNRVRQLAQPHPGLQHEPSASPPTACPRFSRALYDSPLCSSTRTAFRIRHSRPGTSIDVFDHIRRKTSLDVCAFAATRSGRHVSPFFTRRRRLFRFLGYTRLPDRNLL